MCGLAVHSVGRQPISRETTILGSRNRTSRTGRGLLTTALTTLPAEVLLDIADAQFDFTAYRIGNPTDRVQQGRVR
jgi:hypothetical protein